MGEVFEIGELPQGAGQHLLGSGYRRSLVDNSLELGDGRVAGRLHDEGAFSCGLDGDAYGVAGVQDRSVDVAHVCGEGAWAKLLGRRVAECAVGVVRGDLVVEQYVCDPRGGAEVAIGGLVRGEVRSGGLVLGSGLARA